MLRTLGWIIWMFGYMLSRIPTYLSLKRLKRQGKEDEFKEKLNYEVSTWAAKLLRHVKIDLQIEGAENMPPPGEAVVFVANHQSYLDIPILLASISPIPAILAKRELGKIPVLGFWIREIGCVLVQREDVRSGMEALKQAQTAVQGGKSFVVFPEGTRSKGEEMAPFQAGAVRIAQKAGVPIVPISIDGSYKGLEGNGFRLTPASVVVTFLPKVETQGLSKDALKLLPAHLEDVILMAQRHAHNTNDSSDYPI